MDDGDHRGMTMEKDSRIFVAGHRGMVGSAIARRLTNGGYTDVVNRTHAELPLDDSAAVSRSLPPSDRNTWS